MVRDAARADIEAIAARIAQHNLPASLRFTKRLQEAFDRVMLWPDCGAAWRTRLGSLRGLRYYPIRGYRQYIVFYIPRKDLVEIVHVIHGARNVSKILRRG
jgi:toxin ParE1/3/4